MIAHKIPFHSAYIYDDEGERVGNVVSQHYEPKFYDMSNYEKWWVSLFSKRGSTKWTEAEPLAPFSSLDSYSFSSGYGSFFSGAMLLCLTLSFFIFSEGFWLVIGGVFASIISTEVGFSFRLSPQSWWLPLLFVIFSLSCASSASFLEKRSFRWLKIMSRLIVCCLLVSVCGTFIRHVGTSRSASSIVSDLVQEGGWRVTRDYEMALVSPGQASAFYTYYASGLTNVTLPYLSKCPSGSRRKLVFYGLVACRP